MNRYLLLLPLFVWLAACGSPPPHAALTPSPTPTGGPHHLGQTVTVPGWQITIASTKTATTIGLMAPAQHSDRFLILQVTLRNTGQAAATASDTSFYCLDANGTKYAMVQLPAGTPSIDGPLAAGHAASGQITYEVPASVQQFTIQYRSDAGTVLATWQLPA